MIAQDIQHPTDYSCKEHVLAVGEKVVDVDVLVTSRKKNGLTELIQTADGMRSCDCEDVRLRSYCLYTEHGTTIHALIPELHALVKATGNEEITVSRSRIHA